LSSTMSETSLRFLFVATIEVDLGGAQKQRDI
jgi:hypothetical protein